MRLTEHLTLVPLLLLQASAVTLFQTETFDSPTGWTSGIQNPNPPVIQRDSGPLGPGDFALRIGGNGGSGPGGRPVAYTTSFWTGDYSGREISAISMDLRNIGSTPVLIRVAIDGPGGWFITPAQPLSLFQPWSSHEFSLRTGDLLSAGGTNPDATLAAVGEVRILHSGSSSFRGDVSNGRFLVDNVTAVPEPGTAGLIGFTGLLLAFRKRLIALE